MHSILDMDLTARLEFIMSACGWERSDLVAASGETSSVVSQWLGHGSKVIKSIAKLEAAVGIAERSGFNVLWIARGIGEPRTKLPSWPFLRVTPAVWDSLDAELRERIETMVEGAIAVAAPAPAALASTPAAWRSMARQIAASVDTATLGDQIKRFVEEVDAQFGATEPQMSSGASKSVD